MDKNKLAVIHIVKKELNLSDKEYRGILKDISGVTSAKELDEAKFKKLMNYFVRSKYYRINPFGLTIRQKLYIRHLAQELGWESVHLNNFIHKYYGKSGSGMLTRRQAIKLIESLKAVKQHQREGKG